MADYADALAAAAVKTAEHAYGPLERFAAESAETFVDKENIRRESRAGIGECESECKRSHETLAARDSGHGPLVVAVECIADKDDELTVAAAEPIAVGEFGQIIVGIVEQSFQHKTLRYAVKLIARGRA